MQKTPEQPTELVAAPEQIEVKVDVPLDVPVDCDHSKEKD